MTRSQAREIAVQILFSYPFNGSSLRELLAEWTEASFFERLSGEDELYETPPGPDERDYITRVVAGVEEHLPELDSYIEKYSVGWEFGRISGMARAAMRVCMFEVLYMDDIPNSAAINEAVEILKKYEPREIVSFTNGLLGSFIRAQGHLQ